MSVRRLLPAAALVLAAFALPAQSPAAVSPFSARFTTNAAGDISIIGNTSLTCPASGSCATAQAGGADQNNSFAMAYVDVDSDATTFDSSSATLTLPADGQVMFAGLYWGGRSSAGTGGGAAAAPSAASRATVKLKAPGSGTYATVTGAETGSYSSSGEDAYQAFADVTSQVQAAGPGVYTVGNVQLGRGQNTYGGWTLVIAYRDDAAPPRNLAVFDGFQVLRNSGGDSSKTITVSGMQAPPAGAVTARVGVVAYDGDRGLTGDVLKLNGTSLSDALHPVDDVFNSTIADLGVADTGRSPSYANLLGLDASIFGADGLIANGATSASIALTTGGETYFPGVVTSSIDLYAPHVEVTKSVTDLNGGDVAIGDTLEYSIQVHNSGGDSADAVVVDDAVPAHTTYVPGSLAIASGTGAGSLTDASGDDRGDVTAGVVHARLGTGATPSSGGTLAVGATSVVTFRVQVDGGLANGTSIANQAEVPHVASILGSPLLARSATVTSTVVVPPVSTPDPGPAPTPDPGPAPTPDPGPAPTPDPGPAPLPDQPVTPSPAPPPAAADPGPALPPAAPVKPPAKTPASPMIAMGVTGPRTVRQGESARYTVVVRSTGDTAAGRVQVTVPVPAGMTVARMPKGSRLVRGVVVMPARTMARGSRRTIALWFKATGSTTTVTLAPTVTASGLRALHGRAPTRVTRPVEETAPAVAG